MRSSWLQLLSVCLLVGLAAVPLTACGGSTAAGDTGTATSATGIAQEKAAPTGEPVLIEATEVPTSLPSPTSTEVTPTETATAMPAPLQDQEEQADTMANAGNPDLNYAQVIFVKATQNSAGLWRFDTTVRHNDQGWDDYADAWQVIDPQTNEILAERILLHPHDNEQPFTRSQDNIEIPPNVTQVLVRAKDNVEGFGGQEVLVDLTAGEGENFEVIHTSMSN